MPAYVVSKIADGLNEDCKSIKESKVTLLGMAYKKDVDDPRESPGFRTNGPAAEEGSHGPLQRPSHSGLPPMRHYPDLRMSSQELTVESLRSEDCVLIVTDHSAYDWNWIGRHAPLIVDTRNAMKNAIGPLARIIRA